MENAFPAPSSLKASPPGAYFVSISISLMCPNLLTSLRRLRIIEWQQNEKMARSCTVEYIDHGKKVHIVRVIPPGPPDLVRRKRAPHPTVQSRKDLVLVRAKGKGSRLWLWSRVGARSLIPHSDGESLYPGSFCGKGPCGSRNESLPLFGY